MLLVSLSFACMRIDEIPTEFPTPEPPPKATPLPKIKLRPERELEKQIETIAQQEKGFVGVAAVLLETGDSASLNGDQQFPMQSVYKMPIAMAVLYQETRGRLSVDEKIGVKPSDFVRRGVRSPLRDEFPQGGEFSISELIGLSMSKSDGTASDVLMDQVGGPTEVEDYLKQIGVTGMQVANSEKQIFEDWETQYKNSSTPMAAIELLRALHEGGGLTPDTRELLLYFMKKSDPGSRRLKRLLPKETVVAHKTGTGGNKDNVNSATNDIGLIDLPNGRHIAIAVYIANSTDDMWIREKTIAEIAKAVWDEWNK